MKKPGSKKASASNKSDKGRPRSRMTTDDLATVTGGALNAYLTYTGETQG